MRTTIKIDADVLAAAKLMAQREGRTLGDVISALARRGLSRDARAEWAERNGIPLLPILKGASPVNLERVNQWRDEGP